MTLSRFLGALALVCAATLAHAHGLAPIDALADAPLAAQAPQRKALPANVQHIAREERLGLPTFVQLQPSMAKAGAVNADPANAARDALKGLAGLYGISAQEVDAAVLHHVQTLPGGARLVRLTSQRDGIEVFREQATVLLDAGTQATAIGGYLGSTALAPEPATTAKAALAQPLAAAGAVAQALQDWGFAPDVEYRLQPNGAPAGAYQWWALPAGVGGADGATLASARTKPVWFRLPEGLVAAIYVEVRVRQAGQEHAYAYVVASADGRLLLRHNQTAHAEFSYRVFADTTPPYTPWPGAQGRNGTPHPTGTPNGYAAPAQPSSLVTLQNAPFSQSYTDSWLPDGAAQTSGNNVHAYADLVAPDGLNPGDENQCGTDLARDFRACVTAPGVFDSTYDPALGAQANQAQAAASVTNLFYTTNWLHDWFYDAGFNEAAGNAQADNFGRGGQDGDAMRAEALDYSGTNNANMSTPADGAPPRMQMYRFLNRGGVQASANGVTFTQPPAGAQFGPLAFDLTADVVVAAPADGCTPLTNAASLTHKIALIDRGICEFSAKVLNAQQAGAAGVVIVNNVASAPTAMGAGTSGASASVTIAAIMVAQADRAALAGVTLHMQGSGAERSSALDNTVIAHEWGHFISNRLIGDASGLTTNHARGLGEGWGDFHALLMMARAEDMYAPANSNWSGTYAMAAHAMSTGASLDASDVAYYGMRRYPYSTTMAKNPLTLRHITDGQALPGTAPRNPSVGGLNAEVHNMGEVWAAMLWECYASLLNAHPFQEAQDRMKQYLVAAYKLTPVNPTLIEARDALLAAARANDPADYQRFAAAFAKRGAGALAQVPDRYSATNAGVVEDFGTVGVLEIADMQLSLTASGAQMCDADTVLDSGETGVLRITLRNRGMSATDTGTVTLSANLPGLTFPDGATVNVPGVNGSSSTTVTARVQLAGLAAPGAARITAHLAYTGQPTTPADRTLDLPLHRDDIAQRATTDDAEAETSAMAFGSTLPAHAATWGVQTGETLPYGRFYAGGTPEAVGSHWMRTPPLQAGAGNLVVSFKHRYRFEQDGATSYDGGQLMLSTDNGATWASVNGTAAGYNGTINGASGNPAEGEAAYVGQSPAWPAMATATVNLGTAYAGQTVRLAWVVHTDPASATEGWEVDDIAITGITNHPFPRVVADMQTCAPGLVATDGTPQSATVGTAFPWPLTVRLRGAAGAPQAGETVTFTVPSSGASAVLAASTVVTDTNGLAVAPATANGEVGSYTVTASAGSYTTSFVLANTAVPAAAGLTAINGTPQSVQVGTAFAQPLRVRLLDVNNAPMAGVSVGFAAPAAGASATLSALAVLTDANGEASITATANGTAGSYSVTASAGSFTAGFSLTNTAAPAGALALVSGAPQSAQVGAAFAQPLRVRLLDVNNAPMAGVSVGFAAPPAGASATLSAPAALTDANGEAAITATANGTAGSYSVTASVGSFTASFSLTNTAAPAVAGALAAVSGMPQSAPVGTAFAQPLRVRLLDVNSAPMAGVSVGFAAPAAGASATLSASAALTDANGEAAITVTANGTAGSYTVTATHAGFTAGFALRNTTAPVGSGGGGSPLVISGPSPGGQGTVTATVQSPPANAYFSQSTFANEVGAGVPSLTGYRFPYGLTGFALENVGQGGTVTLRIQYPGPVPAGAEYWKYGLTTPAGTPHWHQIPMVLVSADTIEITLTDGSTGDTDAQADGTITDPGGLRVLAAPPPGAPAVAIPALSPMALTLLVAGLGLLGWRRRS
ncbi:MAG: M36 family metallopeptidase [Comamonadaceae bacterium]|nr:M36 family metallopeptidase [Comamonadaceae bacterium]